MFRPLLHAVVRALPLFVGTVLLLGLVSWSSVTVNLSAQAAAARAAWHASASALMWDFSEPRSIVLPGSSGVDASDAAPDGLRSTFRSADLDLSLRLRSGAIPLAPVAAARLRVHNENALVAWLIATDANGADRHMPKVAIEPRLGSSVTLPLVVGQDDAVAYGLRLHLSGAAGDRVTLRHLSLLTTQPYRDELCLGAPSIDATLVRCGRHPSRVRAPVFATPEALLRWRDAIAKSSLLVVEPPLPLAARAIGWRPIIAILGALCALALLVTALRPRAGPHSDRAALTVLATVLALLWLGIGDDSTRDFEVAAFIVCCVVLWLLHDRTVRWSFWGDTDAWRGIALVSLCFVPLLLAALWLQHRDNNGFALQLVRADRFWFYPLWAGLQQYLLLCVIAPRMRRLGRSPEAGAWLAGALFALLHLPNFALMLATFVGGTAWAWHGYRHRALLPLALSHAATGLLLVLLAPDWLLRSAEIGGRYLLPR